MRTEEEKLATRLRKAAEREAHREKVFTKHPPQIRYAKRKFKTGGKRQKKRSAKIQLGLQ
jgi:hypothetical protein